METDKNLDSGENNLIFMLFDSVIQDDTEKKIIKYIIENEDPEEIVRKLLLGEK